MTMDWHDYEGGELPVGAQWVQMADGRVVTLDQLGEGTIGVIRFYGPAPVLAVGTPQPIDEPAPILPIPREQWPDVVDECADALLKGENVLILHPEGYERCGLDIPAKRGQNNCHEYRPIVVLEWINSQVRK